MCPRWQLRLMYSMRILFAEASLTGWTTNSSHGRVSAGASPHIPTSPDSTTPSWTSTTCRNFRRSSVPASRPAVSKRAHGLCGVVGQLVSLITRHISLLWIMCCLPLICYYVFFRDHCRQATLAHSILCMLLNYHCCQHRWFYICTTLIFNLSLECDWNIDEVQQLYFRCDLKKAYNSFWCHPVSERQGCNSCNLQEVLSWSSSVQVEDLPLSIL